MPRKKAEKAEKEESKIDVSTLEVTRNELAELTGITSQYISRMTTQGILKRNGSKYPLKENLLIYYQQLKNRTQNRTELELENIALKNERIKEELKSWRLSRDAALAAEIIRQLNNLLNALKKKCEVHADVVKVIDGLMAELGRIDTADISYIVEGETADEL